MKKTLYIKKKDWIDWYFDGGTCENVIELLIEKGKVELKDLLEDLGYLPISLIVNQEILSKEDIEENEVEEPCKKYKLKFYKVKKENLTKKQKEDRI